MHSLNLLQLLLASTSLVRAIPHARNPAHYHLHRRVVNVQPLDGRSIIDGKCGGGAGSCGAGYCCSQWGYCGTADDYCGSGCQSSFGSCHANDSAVPNKANPGPAVSHAAPAAGTAAITSTFAAIAPTQILSTAASAPTPSAAASGSGSGSGYGSGSSSGSSSGGSAYKMYTGDGTVGAGWPAQNAWIDFDSMWNANVPAMQTSCQRLWNQAQNTADNIQAIKSAIETESASCGVDKRFILAIVMQESAGCVRVPTTFGSISNPGLMQSHGGSGTCYNESNCPDSAVLQMIKDGTSGTPTDGLQQCIAQTGVSDVSKYYKAARIYNSGSIASSGDLGQGIATHCYSSDIANRLTGWVDAPTACNLN